MDDIEKEEKATGQVKSMVVDCEDDTLRTTTVTIEPF
jgi:hypothetical protein